MKLGPHALERLGEHVTGNGEMTPYKSGPMLVKFFNNFGEHESYGSDFPARWRYADEKLAALNGTPAIGSIIEATFDPLQFDRAGKDADAAIADMNKYLRRDDLQIVLVGGAPKLRTVAGQSVSFTAPDVHASSFEFIRENIQKCEQKLRDDDYRGAITNARSLSEEVLCDIERQLDPAAKAYDGDLPKLYKRVRKLLKMEPSDYDSDGPVAQMLRGLVTIIDGMAGMSNQLGDRHGGSGLKPKHHHAALVVNAAMTLCSFVSASFAQQLARVAEAKSG